MGTLTGIDATAGNVNVGIAGALRGEIVPAGDANVITTATTRTIAANTVYLMRWAPLRSWALTLAAWNVTANASVDDPFEVGIWDSGIANLLATTGAVTGKLNATTGIKTASLAYTVQAGTVYYVAAVGATVGGTTAGIDGKGWLNSKSILWFGSTLGTALIATASLTTPASGMAGGLTGPTSAVGFTAAPQICLREV